jgi:hypothetical protein
MRRMLIWPDIRHDGYPANLKPDTGHPAGFSAEFKRFSKY